MSPGCGPVPGGHSSVPCGVASLPSCVRPCFFRYLGLLLPPHADRLLRSAPLTGVRLGSLAACRQVASMAHPAVRADLDQALDVQRDLAAKIALHLVAAVDQLAEPVDLLLGEVADAGIRVDIRLGQDLLRGRQADSEDVGEGDLDALLARDVDAGNACHRYPCRCLCFGLVQMTITVPWRRMTLQLSQRALTEALTFNGSSTRARWRPAYRSRLFQAVGDPTAGQVVGRQLDPDAIPWQDPDEIHPELPADVGKHPMAILQLDREHRVGERFDDRSFNLDRVTLGHRLVCFPFSR